MDSVHFYSSIRTYSFSLVFLEHLVYVEHQVLSVYQVNSSFKSYLNWVMQWSIWLGLPGLNGAPGLPGIKGQSGQAGKDILRVTPKNYLDHVSLGLPGLAGPSGDRVSWNHGLIWIDVKWIFYCLQGMVGRPGLPGLPGLKGMAGEMGRDGRATEQGNWYVSETENTQRVSLNFVQRTERRTRWCWCTRSTWLGWTRWWCR